MADNECSALGLKQFTLMDQLFYTSHKSVHLIIIAPKIVDDIILTGTLTHVDSFLHSFNNRFEQCSVAAGPGHLRFNSMNIIQNFDNNYFIDADDAFNASEEFSLTIDRRRFY